MHLVPLNLQDPVLSYVAAKVTQGAGSQHSQLIVVRMSTGSDVCFSFLRNSFCRTLFLYPRGVIQPDETIRFSCFEDLNADHFLYCKADNAGKCVLVTSGRHSSLHSFYPYCAFGADIFVGQRGGAILNQGQTDQAM